MVYMKIHKIGHCCLVIEHKGLKIMTDPALFSTGHGDVTGLDVLIITHEHQDHLHVPSVEAVLANNPGIRILTNASVHALLEIAGINAEIVAENETVVINDITFTASGHDHAQIYNDIGLVETTGFRIDDFWYPADAFTTPPSLNSPVNILALPVAGPWMKMQDAIDYALTFGDVTAFPVHNGFFAEPGPFHMIPERVFANTSVKFVPLKNGEVLDIE